MHVSRIHFLKSLTILKLSSRLTSIYQCWWVVVHDMALLVGMYSCKDWKEKSKHLPARYGHLVRQYGCESSTMIALTSSVFDSFHEHGRTNLTKIEETQYSQDEEIRATANLYCLSLFWTVFWHDTSTLVTVQKRRKGRDLPYFPVLPASQRRSSFDGPLNWTISFLMYAIHLRQQLARDITWGNSWSDQTTAEKRWMVSLRRPVNTRYKFPWYYSGKRYIQVLHAHGERLTIIQRLTMGSNCTWCRLRAF